MSRYWTHYWRRTTLDAQRRHHNPGTEFSRTAGNQFRDIGVSQGDVVYCLSAVEGSVILVGKLSVDAIMSQEEAEEYFQTDIWTARDHLIAYPGSRSSMYFDRVVPIDVLRNLRFNTAKGETAITFQTDNQIDQQTLRRVRELTPPSARLFDKIIDER